MSTIQIQKKKTVTFDELCPIWSTKSAKGDLQKEIVDGKLVDLNNSRCCVVGEATRFISYHGGGCDKCLNHAYFIWSGAGGQTGRETSYKVTPGYVKAVNKFVEHWNAKHI